MIDTSISFLELLSLLTKIKGLKAYKVSRPSEVMGFRITFNFWVIKIELPVLFFHGYSNSILEKEKNNQFVTFVLLLF